MDILVEYLFKKELLIKNADTNRPSYQTTITYQQKKTLLPEPVYEDDGGIDDWEGEEDMGPTY